MSGSIFFLDFKEITIKMTPILFILHLVNAIYTVVADQMFLVHFSVQSQLQFHQSPFVCVLNNSLTMFYILISSHFRKEQNWKRKDYLSILVLQRIYHNPLRGEMGPNWFVSICVTTINTLKPSISSDPNEVSFDFSIVSHLRWLINCDTFSSESLPFQTT